VTNDGRVDDVVSLEDIRRAAERLAGVTVRTPLLPVPRVAQGLLLKPESLQPTGSFKLRGAYNAIASLPEDERRRGVVAHSSGNHGYAVAYAAALLGVPATVVVPDNAPPVKTDAIAACGATLVTVFPSLPARLEAMRELSQRHGYCAIPPFDDPRVIAGQGTIGLEVAEDCPEPDVVLVPVSGGGLISGIAVAVKALCPSARIVGVEPADAADARASLLAGERVAWPPERTARTIADSLRVEQIGVLPFAHMSKLVSGIVTVTDDELLGAIRVLAGGAHLVAEPGGAAAVAAFLYHGDELPAGANTIAVVSGGNVDPALLAKALARG
jgi:threo-3-hydroxy-L-aspartate ammonia-lyase